MATAACLHTKAWLSGPASRSRPSSTPLKKTNSANWSSAVNASAHGAALKRFDTWSVSGTRPAPNRDRRTPRSASCARKFIWETEARELGRHRGHDAQRCLAEILAKRTSRWL